MTVALLIAVDTAAGAFYRTGREASLVSVPPQSGRLSTLIIVFPGYLMPAAEVGRAFAPHLDPSTGLLLVQYAERGVDPKAIRTTLVPSIRSLRPERIIFYGASMGGMCAHDVLQDTDDLGIPVELVLDTAPASPDDVRRPGWSFAPARAYRGGPIASGIWRLLASLPGTRPDPEPDADRDAIASARHRTAAAGMPAVTSEADYINGFVLHGPVRQPSRVVYLHAANADRDPLIRVDRAMARWRIVYPGLVAEEIPGRHGDWHIPIVERPAETVAAIMAQ
ncbi:hypothetical protein [Frankia sp. CiP3]|uniref:hypothetical protein n=1 Tax=Frankia sp. CiP3 TaxID=2880971 RepID=UPI001EF4DE4C|nr:hypothetical protein [Frankia sp. CiP3]